MVDGSKNIKRRGIQAAVALDYDGERDSVPRVVAKGRGAVAEKIIEIALDNGVAVRRDADLLQVLEALDIDAEIPPAAFHAVAEILSYIYQANGRLSAGDTTED